MGMDAEVDVWVGVSDDSDIDYIIEQLPKDLFDEDGDPFWLTDDKNRCLKKYGIVVKKFYCSEEICGFGVSVFSHDWDYGVVEFDVQGISEQIKHATEKLQKLFDDCGIEEEIKTLCQTDYS